MENIIKNISQIEHTAKNIVSSAYKTCEDLTTSFNEEKNAFLDSIENTTNKRIEEINNNSISDDDKKIDEIKKEYETYSTKLDYEYNTNKSKYVDAIFKEIITY